ncbi:DegV family protein [Vagococcus sp. DIV0080]|uniref:DegV family protein n=1 Tax=Candidatus Vagococcus giribetii TaxID=2230876 RepID=A0ABS3HU67_9ENTE|nr:DegV family protein [Vagococcus sp. DIV0080]MBO0476777.1 DegV family protein [Vagococcus sp. DIV0080]
MKIAVVTDSTAYIKEDYRTREDLFIVPVPLIIDDQVYLEDIDIHVDGFYDKLRQAKSFPKTSQPAIGELFELYDRIGSLGYDAVISIHMSSGISGLVHSVASIASEVKSISVYPFDSLLTSGPMGKMVEVAMDMAQQGEATPDMIVSKLTQMREKVEGLIVVDDLNHLVRGGRLKNGAAIIGTLLKIKPILMFKNGDIVLSEKIRSQKKALKRVEDIALNEVASKPDDSTFYVIHCNNLETAEIVKHDLLKKHKELEVIICDFGPVIGTHLGEKSVAIGVAPKG